MMQFQENTRTDGRTDGQIEGRTDRRTDKPHFIGPFRLLPSV